MVEFKPYYINSIFDSIDRVFVSHVTYLTYRYYLRLQHSSLLKDLISNDKYVSLFIPKYVKENKAILLIQNFIAFMELLNRIYKDKKDIIERINHNFKAGNFGIDGYEESRILYLLIHQIFMQYYIEGKTFKHGIFGMGKHAKLKISFEWNKENETLLVKFVTDDELMIKIIRWMLIETTDELLNNESLLRTYFVMIPTIDKKWKLELDEIQYTKYFVTFERYYIKYCHRHVIHYLPISNTCFVPDMRVY